MVSTFLRVTFLGILTLFLTSCSSRNVIVKDMAIINHKNLAGANSFGSLVESLVQKQSSRIKSTITDDVVLVSDFVNLDRLKNRSKLGFLLSEHLKDSLSNKNIIVRAVELGQDFQFGHHGLNLLTRNQKDISNKFVDNKYAFVGTYTITTESLIIFIKLIDLSTGNILSSASGSTLIDNEIRELEKVNKTKNKPSVIAPMVL